MRLSWLLFWRAVPEAPLLWHRLTSGGAQRGSCVSSLTATSSSARKRRNLGRVAPPPAWCPGLRRTAATVPHNSVRPAEPRQEAFIQRLERRRHRIPEPVSNFPNPEQNPSVPLGPVHSLLAVVNWSQWHHFTNTGEVVQVECNLLSNRLREISDVCLQ